MEKLDGDPFFFKAIDEFYSSYYFCQALRSDLFESTVSVRIGEFESHRDYSLR